MGFLKRFAQGELGLGRIEGFSDGVFAIVVSCWSSNLKFRFCASLEVEASLAISSSIFCQNS
jgi:hypothetical protein